MDPNEYKKMLEIYQKSDKYKEDIKRMALKFRIENERVEKIINMDENTFNTLMDKLIVREDGDYPLDNLRNLFCKCAQDHGNDITDKLEPCSYPYFGIEFRGYIMEVIIGQGSYVVIYKKDLDI